MVLLQASSRLRCSPFWGASGSGDSSPQPGPRRRQSPSRSSSWVTSAGVPACSTTPKASSTMATPPTSSPTPVRTAPPAPLVSPVAHETRSTLRRRVPPQGPHRLSPHTSSVPSNPTRVRQRASQAPLSPARTAQGRPRGLVAPVGPHVRHRTSSVFLLGTGELETIPACLLF